MSARTHILDQLAGGARTNPTPCCTCGVNAHLTDARLCIACERERRAEVAEKLRQEHRYESLTPAVPAGPWHQEYES